MNAKEEFSAERGHAKDGDVSLLRLAEGKRLVVLVGTGGVGKTTVAASLAVAAARSGRRTLCLTIDPAHRLAQSLGYPGEKSVVIRPEDLGGESAATLTMMMLDAGETFDEIIVENAKNRAVADKILGHRIYRYLSRHLAGTQAFMAMEKVLAVEKDDRFDLVVLDTPPSERALDFFDAPDRMLEILESPLTEWLGRAASFGDRLGFGFVKKATQKTFSSLGQVTGSGFLSDLGEFLANLSELLGGFRSRAEKVKGRLRRVDVGYALVFAPHNLSLHGALSLARGLEERGLLLRSFVLNRVPEAPSLDRAEFSPDLESELFRLGFGVDEKAALEKTYAEAVSRYELSIRAARLIADKLRSESSENSLYTLDDTTEPIHDLLGLARLSRTFRRVG